MLSSMPRRDRPDEITLSAWRSFLESHARITAALDRELRAAHDLPLTWYDVLYQLQEHDGRLRMSDLAEAVLLSRPNCTRLVDRMVEVGLLERQIDPDDARVRWARITPEGRRRFRRAAPTHLAGIQFHFGQHLDDETAATVGAALAKLS